MFCNNSAKIVEGIYSFYEETTSSLNGIDLSRDQLEDLKKLIENHLKNINKGNKGFEFERKSEKNIEELSKDIEKTSSSLVALSKTIYKYFKNNPKEIGVYLAILVVIVNGILDRMSSGGTASQQVTIIIENNFHSLLNGISFH